MRAFALSAMLSMTACTSCRREPPPDGGSERPVLDASTDHADVLAEDARRVLAQGVDRSDGGCRITGHSPDAAAWWSNCQYQHYTLLLPEPAPARRCGPGRQVARIGVHDPRSGALHGREFLYTSNRINFDTGIVEAFGPRDRHGGAWFSRNSVGVNALVTRTGAELIPGAHAIVRFRDIAEPGDVLFARQYPDGARHLGPYPFAFFATDSFMTFQVRDPDAQMRIYVAGPNAEQPTELELPRGAYGELHASGHRAVLTVSSDLYLYDHREGRASALTREDSITERSAFLHGDTLAFIQGRSPSFGTVQNAQVAVMDLRT